MAVFESAGATAGADVELGPPAVAVSGAFAAGAFAAGAFVPGVFAAGALAAGFAA
jgi:hypothetical protein